MGGLTTQAVMSAQAQHLFLAEERRNDGYTLGRVKHFVEMLKSGRKPDPIDITWIKLRNRRTVAVNDGHHRYAAHVLAGWQWIDVKLRSGVLPDSFFDEK